VHVDRRNPLSICVVERGPGSLPASRDAGDDGVAAGQRFLKGEALANVEGAACGCSGFGGGGALRLSATVSS
jgi:hypothetical protein